MCENTLFLLNKSGRVVVQRSLEQTPVCACSGFAGPGLFDNIIVAMQEGTLQIYSEMNLLGGALTQCLLSSVYVWGRDWLNHGCGRSRQVSLGFGTRLATTIASSAASRDLDYNKVDEEHRQLLTSSAIARQRSRSVLRTS